MNDHVDMLATRFVSIQDCITLFRIVSLCGGNFVLPNLPFFFFSGLPGCFARDPSILHRVGHVLLKLNSVEPRRARRLIFADDLFQFSKVPTQKTLNVVNKAIENLSGCK